jgi:hypothetical protein
MPLDSTRPVVDRCYGYLKLGAQATAAKKKTLRFRLRRETIRLLQQFHDVLHRDGMLQPRRRLSLTKSICRNTAWQTAHQLMVKYPYGISDI